MHFDVMRCFFLLISRILTDRCEPEERLVEEDHNLLSTQVLPNHPNSAAKVGCGIDYFKVSKSHLFTLLKL